MHLININTLSLKEHYEGSVPDYAILSHTWGKDEEELHFKDMGVMTKVEKLRYPKIAFLCRQAAADDLEWAWCDTCCIDKSSSAELSESINSMFRWYQNSKVCYVYLQDTSTDDGRSTKEHIEQCRWIKRGWTLQELLAPKQVHFFDRDGVHFGTKLSLSQHLRDVTGINFGAMQWARAIPSYSIASRLSWMSGRKTKRLEDQAYCMLGILGVNIPLLYGEGSNAFRRLLEELIKVSDDETVFAHRGRGLLAESAGDYSDGLSLTILSKTVSNPYSLTNAGLHIQMRLLGYHELLGPGLRGETSDLVYGILNCHYNTHTGRGSKVAVPLRPTSVKDTYRREPGPPCDISIERCATLPLQSIFIQTRAVQLSRITLLEDFDASWFKTRAATLTTSFVYNKSDREYRLYPEPEGQYEAMLFTVSDFCDPISRDFVSLGFDLEDLEFIIFFELATHAAGVLRVPRERLPDGRRAYDYLALDNRKWFMNWLRQGKSASAHYKTRPGRYELDLRLSVASSSREHFVWSLNLDVDVVRAT